MKEKRENSATDPGFPVADGGRGVSGIWGVGDSQRSHFLENVCQNEQIGTLWGARLMVQLANFYSLGNSTVNLVIYISVSQKSFQLIFEMRTSCSDYSI